MDFLRDKAQKLVDICRDQLGVTLDFDRAGVEWLDAYLGRLRTQLAPERFDGIAVTAGCFLGECILRTHGGEWIDHANGYGIRSTDGSIAFPITKALKRVENGEVDSIVSFFDIVPEIGTLTKR